MGKKLDAILGRSFKPYKFKSLINLSLSRLAVLKNQKHARYSVARSDVVQLLSLGHRERALIRVEQVIKEQNMLDVLGMIEGYCVVLSERVKVIENEKECPDELKEAISSLVFAAARCGEFPELHEIRRVFTTRYGKEFTARAVELRNNCGVNPKMIQKLSTRQPTLVDKMKALKEIAKENGIALQLEEPEAAPPIVTEEHLNKEETNQPTENEASTSKIAEQEQTTDVEGFRNSMNKRKQYKDVADAAHEAFMSAAYAAAAARAAVELSRSSPRPPDTSDDRRKEIFNLTDEVLKPNPEINEVNHSRVTKNKYNINSDDEEHEACETKTKDQAVYDDSDSEDEDENTNSDGGTKLPYFSGKNVRYSFGGDSVTDKKTYFSAGKMWLNTAGRPVSMTMRR